jgi:hypothetical protein
VACWVPLRDGSDEPSPPLEPPPGSQSYPARLAFCCAAYCPANAEATPSTVATLAAIPASPKATDDAAAMAIQPAVLRLFVSLCMMRVPFQVDSMPQVERLSTEKNFASSMRIL